MINRVKLFFYYFRFLITKNNNQKAYEHLRNSYMIHHLWRYIDFVCKINSLFYKKYKIDHSNGILGKIDKKRCDLIVKEIDLNGYYIFDEKLDEESIKQLYHFAENKPSNYNSLLDDGSVVYSVDKKRYIDNRNKSNLHVFSENDVLFESEFAKNIFFDQNFLHISNEYLKSKPLVDCFTMWWSNPVSDLPEKFRFNFKNNAAQMFHYDMDRMKFLKFFIYLTDVDENTGPHVYVKGSHKKPSFFINSDGRYNDELIYFRYGENVVHLKGKKGTIMAVDTRGIHKGMELKQGERLIFLLEFTNSFFGKPNLDEYKKNDGNIPLINEKFKYTYSLFFK